MKVNTNLPLQQGLGIEASKNEPARASDAKGAKAPSASNQGSSVEISENAKLLRTANEIARQNPGHRSEKVAALKKQIADGSYNVGAEAIADRLVDEHFNAHFGKNQI